MESLLSNGQVVADCAILGGDENLAGFIFSRIALDEAEVLTLVIANRFRNRGLGRGLVKLHIANLNLAGVRSVFLEVAEDNIPAIRLYEGQGFQTIGARNAYYSGPDASRTNALIMKYVMA